MDDRELDIALRVVAGERHAPPDRLVRLAKSRIRGRRLIQVTAFSSLAMQVATLVIVLFTLAWPGVPTAARIFGAISLIVWTGALAVTIVAARTHLVRFFDRVESLIG